jgi:hypothetical protein
MGSTGGVWDTAAGQQILYLDLIIRKISECQHLHPPGSPTPSDSPALPAAAPAATASSGRPSVEADYLAYFLLTMKQTDREPRPALRLLPGSCEGKPSPCPFHDPTAPAKIAASMKRAPLSGGETYRFSSTRPNRRDRLSPVRHIPTPQGLTERTLGRILNAHIEPRLRSRRLCPGDARNRPIEGHERDRSQGPAPRPRRKAASLHYCPRKTQMRPSVS